MPNLYNYYVNGSERKIETQYAIYMVHMFYDQL